MGQYWIPRSKRGLVDLIAKSDKWGGTKTLLNSYDKKKLMAILHRFRQEHFNDVMKFDKKSAETSQNPQTIQEVSNGT